MSKEVLAMDVDEVFFPMAVHYLLEHNALFGTTYTVDDLTSYRFENVLGLSMPTMVKLIYEFTEADHSHIDPLEKTQEGIDRLKQRFDIDIITARHEQFRYQTESWLSDKIGDFFGDVHCIGYAPVLEKPRTKLQVCQEIGAIALVDDNLDHLRALPEAGLEAVLFGNYPWNQAAVLPVGVTRCEDMLAVAEHFGV